MAEKLNAKSKPVDNIVHLPGIGHNEGKEQTPIDEGILAKSIIEGRQTRFLGIVSLLQDQDGKIADANDIVKQLRAGRKSLTARVVAIGYSMEDVDRALIDASGDEGNLEQREKMRREMRAALGLDDIQGDLFAQAGDNPDVDMDVRAETAGYQAAILQKPASVPERYMASNQAWLRGWHSGQSKSLAARAEAERFEAEEAARMSVQNQDDDGERDGENDDNEQPTDIDQEEELELARGEETVV